MKFVTAYGSVIRKGGVPANPVRRFNKLVDTGISIGCDAEDRLADLLEIEKFKVTAMKPATIDEGVSLPELRDDLRIIQKYGGEVLVAAKGSMLTLVRDHD